MQQFNVSFPKNEFHTFVCLNSKPTNRIREIKVIKGSCDFMEGSSQLNVTTLPGLVAIAFVVVEITIFNLLPDHT